MHPPGIVGVHLTLPGIRHYLSTLQLFLFLPDQVTKTTDVSVF